MILIFGPGYGSALAQPHGNAPALESIHMIDALTGWAVTDQPGANALLYTTDSGGHWRDVTPLRSSGQRVAVVGVAVLNSLTTWVELADRTFAPILKIFHTVDGGRTWRSATVPVLGRIHFVDAHVGWLMHGVGALGSQEVDIYRTTDGGETWDRIAGAKYDNESSGLPFGGNKVAITFRDASTGWVTGATNGNDWLYLYVAHDGGRIWRQQKLPVPSQMTPHWNDWTQPPAFFTARDGVLPVFYSILDASYHSIAMVVVFYVTHDGGTTWKYTTPLPITLGKRLTLSIADIDHGWVTDGRALYLTSDSGRHWTKIEPTLSFANVKQLGFISPQAGWAVSKTYPFLLKTLDGGHRWAPVTYSISQ